MRRRSGLALLGLWAGAGSRAWAQPARVARVGWVGGQAGPNSLPTPTYLEALRESLRDKGWVEGRSLQIEVRWGTRDMAARLAGELVEQRIDVLVVQGTMVLGAKLVQAPPPIVFGFSGDPVEAGLVASFARPGGRMTGVAMQSLQLVGKRMEILKEIQPSVRRIAILANPTHPGEQLELRHSQDAARHLGLEVSYHPVTTEREFEAAFAAMQRSRPDAIIAFPDATVIGQAGAIAAFGARQRIPAVSGWSEFVEAGNLMSYGPNLRAVWRQAADMVDRVLRGARPEDMPVEQPLRYELVLNLKVAQALGITVPQAVLLRADRLIE